MKISKLQGLLMLRKLKKKGYYFGSERPPVPLLPSRFWTIRYTHFCIYDLSTRSCPIILRNKKKFPEVTCYRFRIKYEQREEEFCPLSIDFSRDEKP